MQSDLAEQSDANVDNHWILTEYVYRDAEISYSWPFIFREARLDRWRI